MQATYIGLLLLLGFYLVLRSCGWSKRESVGIVAVGSILGFYWGALLHFLWGIIA